MAPAVLRHDQMDRVRRAAEVIGRMRPDAAVCVFGSLAREASAEPIGDVDLLVVEAERRTQPTAVLGFLEDRSADDPPLNIVTYSSRDLQRVWESGAPIAFHLSREARVLRDPLGLLEPCFAREPRHDFASAARRELVRLTPYRHPGRFNGNLAACFAQAYRVGRTLVMLRLGQHGIWEFGRREAFARLIDVEPERRDAIRTISRLEPFEAWQRRRTDATLPFSPLATENEDVERQLAGALAAVDVLATDVAR